MRWRKPTLCKRGDYRAVAWPVRRTCCSNYRQRDRTDARLCGPKRVGAEWTAVAVPSGRSGRRRTAMGSSAEVDGLLNVNPLYDRNSINTSADGATRP